METRAEHIAWCKQRALEYLDNGDPTNAVASMMSDLNKHEGTANDAVFGMLGLQAAIDASKGDTAAVRRYVEGFN